MDQRNCSRTSVIVMEMSLENCMVDRLAMEYVEMTSKKPAPRFHLSSAF